MCDGRGLNSFADEGVGNGADSERRVTRTENLQQSMDSPEMEEWRKARRKCQCKVARPNEKLVVGTKCLAKET